MKSKRSASVLALVLVVMAVASLLMAAQVSTLLARQRLQRQMGRKVQAQWLAESALDRARVQLARSSDYAGETWQPELAEEDQPSLSANIQLETHEVSKTVVTTARAGREDQPLTAQHVVRQQITVPESGASP
jgi:type II secretory pathway pseudopilin PulG